MVKREAKPGSERDVQRRIITWLRKNEWLVINTSGAWRSARGMAGVSDLICIYRGVTVFLEVKGYDSLNLRPQQEKFLERITEHIDDTLYFNIVNNENFKRIQWFMEEIKNDRLIRGS
jgi:hypothetical protein